VTQQKGCGVYLTQYWERQQDLSWTEKNLCTLNNSQGWDMFYVTSDKMCRQVSEKGSTQNNYSCNCKCPRWTVCDSVWQCV